MASSVAGAVKTAIEAAGLGLSAYRDEAPKAAVLPYAVVHEGISVVPEPDFPAVDDTTGHVSELVQVDLWQAWRHPTTNVPTESYTLVNGLTRALHGSKLPASPKRVFLCTVAGTVRRLERAENKIHVALTLRLRRVM